MKDRVSMLESAARRVPIGTAFYSGPLHNAPVFDVAMAAVRYMRGEPGPLDQVVALLLNRSSLRLNPCADVLAMNTKKDPA